MRVLLLLGCLTACVSDVSATILVEDGDTFTGLVEEDFLMTGGLAGGLEIRGQVLADVRGGRIGGVELYDGADLLISGGDWLGTKERSFIESFDYAPSSGGTDQTVFTIQAHYLRVQNMNLPAARNSWKIEGFLLDGSWFAASYLHDGNTLRAIVNVEISSGGPIFPGDTDGDWDVDVSDLNAVRNNFGAETSLGDADGDAFVDITDLNLVRNNFGSSSQFKLGPEFTVWESGNVPEPPSIFLAASTLIMLGLLCKWAAKSVAEDAYEDNDPYHGGM